MHKYVILVTIKCNLCYNSLNYKDIYKAKVESILKKIILELKSETEKIKIIVGEKEFTPKNKEKIIKWEIMAIILMEMAGETDSQAYSCMIKDFNRDISKVDFNSTVVKLEGVLEFLETFKYKELFEEKVYYLNNELI